MDGGFSDIIADNVMVSYIDLWHSRFAVFWPLKNKSPSLRDVYLANGMVLCALATFIFMGLFSLFAIELQCLYSGSSRRPALSGDFFSINSYID